MAEIGHYAKPPAPGLYHKDGAVSAIMWRRNGLNGHFSDPYSIAALKMVHLVNPAYPAPGARGAKRCFRHVDRKPIFAMQYSGIFCMIGMVVRDYYSIDIPYVFATRSKTPLSLNPAYAGVNNQPHIRCFNIDAVAVAA
jgi:hypothetical protein